MKYMKGGEPDDCICCFGGTHDNGALARAFMPSYGRGDGRHQAKKSVDNVHTSRPGLPRTTAGLARIPHVSATSQSFQGPESRSSPTSGTANPLVRGGFCF